MTLAATAKTNPILIKPLTADDLMAAARLHLAAFPDSALGALGAEAVRRYYEWQLIGPHEAAAFGAYDEGSLAGFCFGGLFRGALSGFLQKNRAFLVARVLSRPWLIANPLFRERLTRGLTVLRRYTTKRAASAGQTPTLYASKSFGILAIAVNPQFQGRGIGKLLMREAETIARQWDFAEMNLTVNPDNRQAISFYESLGWRKVSRDGGWSGSMIKPLVS